MCYSKRDHWNSDYLVGTTLIICNIVIGLDKNTCLIRYLELTFCWAIQAMASLKSRSPSLPPLTFLRLILAVPATFWWIVVCICCNCSTLWRCTKILSESSKQILRTTCGGHWTANRCLLFATLSSQWNEIPYLNSQECTPGGFKEALFWFTFWKHHFAHAFGSDLCHTSSAAQRSLQPWLRTYSHPRASRPTEITKKRHWFPVPFKWHSPYILVQSTKGHVFFVMPLGSQINLQCPLTLLATYAALSRKLWHCSIRKEALRWTACALHIRE